MFTRVDIPDFVKADQARRLRTIPVVARVLPNLPTQTRPQVVARVAPCAGGGFGDRLPLDARRDLIVVSALVVGVFAGSLIW
jgi:hypothetical protein